MSFKKLFKILSLIFELFNLKIRKKLFWKAHYIFKLLSSFCKPRKLSKWKFKKLFFFDFSLILLSTTKRFDFRQSFSTFSTTFSIIMKETFPNFSVFIFFVFKTCNNHHHVIYSQSQNAFHYDKMPVETIKFSFFLLSLVIPECNGPQVLLSYSLFLVPFLLFSHEKFSYFLATRTQKNLANVYFCLPFKPKSGKCVWSRKIYLFSWWNEVIRLFSIWRVIKIARDFMLRSHFNFFFSFFVLQPQSFAFFMWLFPLSTHIIWNSIFFSKYFFLSLHFVLMLHVWMCTIFSCWMFFVDVVSE